MVKRIAFIKFGSFSHINDAIESELRRTFSDHRVDVFDVDEIFDLQTMLRERPREFALASWWAVREYGAALLLRKRSFRECLRITSPMCQRIRSELLHRIDPEAYRFTFQTQSLFDAHLDQVPHFVYTDHTVLANLHYPRVDRLGSMFSKAWIAREPDIYGNADLVFTASNFARDSIIVDYGCAPESVICVFTGTHVDVPDATEPKDYSSPEILFVGVEWERKGGPELVAAFRRVLEARPDAHLTIAGCCPQVDAPNCNIVGRMAPSELVPYFERASIFCLPAWREPAGIAYSEAALYRLPVVATAVGGIPDRVLDGETGYLVPAGDVEALAERLLGLLSDPDRCRALGEAGQQHTRRCFSWDRVGDELHREITLSLASPARVGRSRGSCPADGAGRRGDPSAGR